ncbi:hypothetical protein [Cellulomonas marina]|uniref:Uncharacterized protein n=1 Tax=Cellulomonas marina TaxID=988821 RepID=A0A1I1AJM4_9CELL|nr:hypothetical protein [Cellulomonas marina]GIG30150.1 hypothetical protein Cma02nite_27500 [Cellulomonas marina]SFB38224.1 hypothetical protein SAMN05421867_11927 [Cellulomonas marina]
MAAYRISGTAQTAGWLEGQVSPLDAAVADESGVAVEEALRQDEGVEFTLLVTAATEDEALATAQRVADRLSVGSSVTVLGEVG